VQLGLEREMDGDDELLKTLKRTLQQTGADYTSTMRAMGRFDPRHPDDWVALVVGLCASVRHMARVRPADQPISQLDGRATD
jgi:uncharacterized protein YdiU (UPF0061 family)